MLRQADDWLIAVNYVKYLTILKIEKKSKTSLSFENYSFDEIWALLIGRKISLIPALIKFLPVKSRILTPMES